MAVEVRQLLIKSSVEADGESGNDDSETDGVKLPDACFDPEAFKAEVLEECRRMVVEMLSDVKER